jgi:hemerythrin-like domain-containing protein
MHHAFRRDLDAFSEAVRNTPVGDRKTWRLLADRWNLFSEVLHKHHSAEDELIWPVLISVGTSDDVAVLEAMEAEHEEIDPLLEACAAGFAVLSSRADEDARAALAVRLVAARETLSRHLHHEETEAIPLIQALMTPEDWERIDAEYFKKGLTVRDFATLVPWAAHGLAPEHRERVFADAGTPFRVLWHLTRRRFERNERAAFRYLLEV